MKKLRILTALLVGALCIGTFGTADAQTEWVTNETGWVITAQGGPGCAPTAICFRDTSLNVIAAGQTDTLWEFSLEHLSSDLPGRGPRATAAVGDTMILGYLVFAQDSAGATAANITSITVEVDGRVGNAHGVTVGQSGMWKQLDSLVVRQTPFDPDEQGILVVPIRAAYTTMDNYDPGGAGESPKPKYLAFAADRFRARITSVTGVMTAARAFVRYPKNISGVGSRAQ